MRVAGAGAFFWTAGAGALFGAAGTAFFMGPAKTTAAVQKSTAVVMKDFFIVLKRICEFASVGGSRRSDDAGEVRSLEGRTADETAVDVLLCEELGRVARLH